MGLVRNILAIGGAIGVALATLGAADAAVVITGVTIDSSVGGQNGTVTYSPTNFTDNAAIGRLALTGSENGTSIYWKSFCVDIFDNLTTGTFALANVSTLGVSATKLNQLNALLSNATVSDAASSAAAQLAIWEIINDNSGSYDVRNGQFSVTGVSTTAINTANQMLAQITSNAWQGTGLDMVLLSASGNQTQIVWGATAAQARALDAVPEPSTWAMMLLGFGTMGIVLRRRQGGSALQFG